MSLSPTCVWTAENYTAVQKLSVVQGTTGSLEFTVTDSTGNPIDLTDYAGSSSSSSGDTGVYLVAKDYATATEPLLLVPIEVVDAENGTVNWNYDSDQLRYPGLWLAQVLLVEGGNTRAAYSYYLEISPNLNSRDNDAKYPLTVAEVRLFLRDTNPDANYLLSATEFEDAEVAYAIRRPILEWNESPPPTTIYSTTNFPYRYHWTMAAAAELLRTAAYHYERNRLAYSAGGVSINDKDKASSYMQLANDLRKQWLAWMQAEKLRQSALQCNYSGVLI